MKVASNGLDDLRSITVDPTPLHLVHYRVLLRATSRTRVTAISTPQDLALHCRLLPYIRPLDQEPSLMIEQTARKNATHPL